MTRHLGNMSQPVAVTSRIRLKDFDPDFHCGLKKKATEEKTKALCRRIAELQELLFANANRAVLLIFQGMDCSGKDGAVKRVLEYVNPSGVETANFKTPSSEELSHDFLWRVHRAVPRFGHIGVFNRSHYEEVLIVRVLKLKPLDLKQRFAQINAFERLLTENNITVLKFFLHITKKEQTERLRARLEDRRKQWKFSVEDLKMRKHWKEFEEAYEDAINACSTSHASWHIIPANKKWYRDYVVAKTVIRAMEKLHLQWPKSEEDLSRVKIP